MSKTLLLKYFKGSIKKLSMHYGLDFGSLAVDGY